MQAVKQDALATIARLPEDTDMEEIMCRLYVLENIRRGQDDATKGNSRPAEEVLISFPTLQRGNAAQDAPASRTQLSSNRDGKKPLHDNRAR